MPPEFPHRPLNPSHYISSAPTSLKRRKEAIVDDDSVLRSSLRLRDRRKVSRIGQSCLILCTPPRQGLDMPQLSLPQSTEKGLREVPSSAPRLVETKGIYTFRKGIRIRDYHIPPPRFPAPGPKSSAYQCRDGFDRHDAASPSSARMRRSPPRSSQCSQHSKVDSSSSTSAIESMSLEAISRTPRSDEAPRPIFGQDQDSGHECTSRDFSSPIIKQEDEDGFERWLAQDPEEGRETS
jgi:hypothetical protein